MGGLPCLRKVAAAYKEAAKQEEIPVGGGESDVSWFLFEAVLGWWWVDFRWMRWSDAGFMELL